MIAKYLAPGIIVALCALFSGTPAIADQCEEIDWENGTTLQKCSIPERSRDNRPPVCFKLPDWKEYILCDKEIGQPVRPVEKVVEPSNCKYAWVGDRKRGHWDYVCKNPR